MICMPFIGILESLRGTLTKEFLIYVLFLLNTYFPKQTGLVESIITNLPVTLQVILWLLLLVMEAQMIEIIRSFVTTTTNGNRGITHGGNNTEVSSPPHAAMYGK